MKGPLAVCSLALLLGSCQSRIEKSPPESPAAEDSPVMILDSASATFWPAPSSEKTPAPTSNPTPEPTLSPTLTATAIDPEIHLAFVGDIMLARSLGARIAGGDGETIFASVESVLQSADLAIGNLECALGEGGVKAPKAYTFLAPPQAAGILKSAGFDLLSLANNHILDYGNEGLQQTQEALFQNDIRTVGAGSSSDQAGAAVVIEIRGIQLAFLSYVEVPTEVYGFNPQSWTAGPDTPGVSWVNDEKIAQDLQMLEPAADFIVVLFHYGDEGKETPNRRQVQLSRLAIEHGADLVVGTHPHVLQPAEEYLGRWIYYSLGNFVFDGFTGASNRSAILWITLSKGMSNEPSLFPLVIIDGIPILGE